MTALLGLIYCFLQDMFLTGHDWLLRVWESVLIVPDQMLAQIGDGGLTVPAIADQYAWVLGATGTSQAVAILAGAMGVRFALQSIPFVRWGS